MASEHVRARPVPPLRPYAQSYTGYRDVGLAPAVHRGLPSPHLTLIFTLDDPLVLAQHVDPAQPPGAYWSLLGGLHTTPALITHDGRQSGVQVALNPLGARELLGLPAGEIAGADLDAELVLGPVVTEVRERLLAATGWAERFAVLDRVLLAGLTDRPRVAPEVRHAWGTLLRRGGGVPIGALAEEVGWSSRHLAGRFTAELGLSPKAAARVIRFDRARRGLAARPGTVAAVAAAHGYYDQSHLVRDFHAMAGCSPTAWLAEEFRNVQSAPGDHLAGSLP